MKKAKHILSNYKLFTCNMGQLIPCGLQEVYPGDIFRHSTSAFLRVTPLLAPTMHPVHVFIKHFFVPTRLIWEDFEDFITSGPDGLNASVLPLITLTAPGTGSTGTLADYLGCPAVNGLEVSALPFRAYDLIFNEYFRDQDLVTPLTIDLTSGPDTTSNVTLQNVAWEKDYFTSARTSPQKGPTVTIPLSGETPVLGISKHNQVFGTNKAGYESGGSAQTNFPFGSAIDPASLDTTYYVEGTAAAGGYPDIRVEGDGLSINLADLREGAAIQRYQENAARYGTRYTEYLRRYGVRAADARLQRPEYLGGGKQTLQFSEVLQTGVTTSGNAAGVGTLRGHGIAALRSNSYKKFFEEHGYVVSLMYVQPKSMYIQGLPRHFNYRSKEDYFQYELQHIGQQAILNKEVYAAHATPNGTFGYQDRYDHLRRSESTIAGEFRDTTLDFWHMARKFSSDPALNSTFVTSNPTTRIYASTSTNQLMIMANHSIVARRPVAPVGTSFLK